MSKWVKVESEFLSNALIQAMLSDSSDCDNKRPSTWRGGIVHSFKQINKYEMEICWECSDRFGGIEMGNCKIKSDWWEIL